MGTLWGIVRRFLNKPPSPPPTMSLSVYMSQRSLLLGETSTGVLGTAHLVLPVMTAHLWATRKREGGKEGWHAQMVVRAQSLQACPTLCHPRDCSPPGCSVRGILQARILEHVAIPFSAPVSYVSRTGRPGKPQMMAEQ